MRHDDTALLVGAHRWNAVVVIVAVNVLERLGDVLEAQRTSRAPGSHRR